MSLISKKSWFLLTMILVTLSACSAIPLHSQSLATTPSQLEVLMQYYEYTGKMPATELVQEHTKAKQNLILTKSDTARAELALLLILPNTSFRDTGAALNLLNGFPKDAKLSASMLSFKHLLSALLAEQQLINGNVKELSQKLKNMNEQSQMLKEEQKHSEVLEKKINDIKSMEKNLILRDKF